MTAPLVLPDPKSRSRRNHEPLREVDEWLDRFRRFWTPHLAALATELARGRREQRRGRANEEPDDRRSP